MLNKLNKSVVIGSLLPFLLVACSPEEDKTNQAEAPNHMTYDLALKAMDASEAYARANNWKVTILVTDQNADPVMLRRLDGASSYSIQVAKRKALVVAKTGLSTGEYGKKLKRGEIDEVKNGVPDKGGVPIYVSGKLIGAITTSGVEASQDLKISLAGAKTIGSVSKK